MNKRISFLLFVFLLAGAGMGWLATAAHAAPPPPPPPPTHHPLRMVGH